MGNSKEFTSSYGIFSGSAVWNDTYKGFVATIGTPTAPVAGFTDRAKTTPVGEVKRGNLLQDLKSVTDSLWDMSQDPMNPQISPF
jgi:hypothetical protein